MSHTLRCAVVLALLLFPAPSLLAQSVISLPDVKGFEGTWALDLAQSAGTSPERRLITLSSQWIRIKTHRDGDDRPPVLIYKFDGSNNVNPYGPDTATSRLRREGQNLVTETEFT